MPNNINNMEWHDYVLDGIIIDYDTVLIKVSLRNVCTEIMCENFIGIQYLGQWDESVIKDISVDVEHELCQNARRIVKKNYPLNYLGAGTKSLDEEWLCLNIELLDGAYVRVICTNVYIKA